jgi:hypothetical protein
MGGAGKMTARRGLTRASQQNRKFQLTERFNHEFSNPRRLAIEGAR